MRLSLLEGRPAGADLLVSGGLLVASLTEVWVVGSAPGPQAMGTVVAFVSCVPLAWRRRAPLVSVAGVVVAALLPLLLRPVVETDSLSVAMAWLVAVHAINAYAPARTAATGTVAILVSLAVAIILTPAGTAKQVADVIWTLTVIGAAAASGQVMGRLGARLASERVAAEAAARALERRRLARELHDVVAHGVAVMVVQAGAAQEMIASDPDRAIALLEEVQRTGAQSASELRRMLDVMGEEAAADLEPQPGLTDLPSLVDGVRGTGMVAHLDCSVRAEDVPPALGTTVYRIVQECLTNALKHGHAARLLVAVASTSRFLTVTVDDDGRGSAAKLNAAGGQGHGLHGLEERASLYGGVLHAGPGPGDSGWRVHASFPLSGGLHPTEFAAPSTADPGIVT